MGWYPGGWEYRKAVTVDHTKVTADLTDFPLLISVVDPDLSAAQASGADFLVTAADGVTKLSHEIDSWDAGTQTLVLWVKVPALSSSSDTVLYLYYGNATAANQENVPDVWSNGYAGVWHLGETGSGQVGDYRDSTANANNSTNTTHQPAPVAGMIGGAQHFTGGPYIRVGGNAGLCPASVTMQAWARATAPLPSWEGIVTECDNYDVPKTGLNLQFGSTQNIASYTPPAGYAKTVWPPVVGTWYHVAATNDGAATRLYVGGVQQASLAGGITYHTPPPDLYIAEFYSDILSLPFTGDIDEVRISSVPRSADWLATEYANQSSPATFLALGAQQMAIFSRRSLTGFRAGSRQQVH